MYTAIHITHWVVVVKEYSFSPNFGGRGGKVKTLTPHISKTGGPGGSKFFVVGGLQALKNKILASGPPVKGGPEKNNCDFKKCLRN